MTLICGIIAGLFLLIPIYILVGQKPRERFSDWLVGNWLAPALFVVIATSYLILSSLANQYNLKTFEEILIYLLLPTALMALPSPLSLKKRFLLAVIVILWFWIPMELNLVERHWVKIPIGEKSQSLPTTMYAAILYCFVIFTGWFQINLKCSWRIRWKDIGLVALVLGLLMVVILIPASAIGFVKAAVWDVAEKNPWVPLILLPLFFITPALGEELIYRGVIQNLLSKKINIWAAILIQAVIFGFAHINNSAGDRRFPNWPYVIFATIAGIGYGFVYWRSGNLAVSALLHASVDLTWKVFWKGDRG